MNTNPKKKMCWNCEGNVAIDNEACPYCGVSFNVSPMAGTDPNLTAFASPFKPTTTAALSVPKAPYTSPAEEVKEPQESPPPFTEEPEFALSDLHRTLLTLISLSLGSLLLIFSAILFLFSDANGVFTLHWNGSYWYLYLLIAIPLIYFGWKTMKDFHETPRN